MTPSDDNEEKKTSDKDVLATALERFRLAAEADVDIRRDQLDDMKFLTGQQWPDAVKQARELDNRPCLTINRLPQFQRQIANDQRQNRPSIKVNPVDDLATVETAKIFQGIIRHIEYNSNADVAYDTAIEHQTGGGRGWLRVITDYCDPYSFDQEILIKRIRNPFSVYLDPNSQEPDGSDSNWGFLVDSMSKEDFKSQFPKAELSQMQDWESIGDQTPGWFNKDSCRVVEYFFKTFKEISLVQLSSGQILDKAQITGDLPEGVSIVNERKSLLPAIKWCKTNGIEILESTDWLGAWIPILPVLGNEADVDGKLILSGIVRDAKDSQRMYNYWASSETETISLAPRAPFIGYEGQFEGFESQWASANIKNHAYLQVKATTVAGQPAPLPQRNVYEAPVQAITNARMQSAEDLKATTGMYDATLGNRPVQQSGIAINRQNAQAQTTNYHFIDNFSRTQRHLGRILVDLIPKIYSEPQAIRTIGEDGEIQIVEINKIFQKNGQDQAHYLNAGKYDVTISSGPSFETKRQEAVASMADLTKSYPPLMQYAGDILVRNMDWPGAEEIADRLKKTLPPGIAETDKDKQSPIPPQAQQQIQQMGQMIQQLTAHLTEKTQIINTKTMELESRERIALAQVQAEVQIALAKTGSADAQTLLKEEIGVIKHRLDLLHDNLPIGNEDENDGSGAPQMGAANPQPQQQPTGGQSPGQPMGAQP